MYWPPAAPRISPATFIKAFFACSFALVIGVLAKRRAASGTGQGLKAFRMILFKPSPGVASAAAFACAAAADVIGL